MVGIQQPSCGEKIHIHGTNRHQEFPWLGDAMPQWLTERDMLDIRYGMNTNFMRTAHYPHMPAVYDFNDRHGIITDEEFPTTRPLISTARCKNTTCAKWYAATGTTPRFSFGASALAFMDQACGVLLAGPAGIRGVRGFVADAPKENRGVVPVAAYQPSTWKPPCA